MQLYLRPIDHRTRNLYTMIDKEDNVYLAEFHSGTIWILRGHLYFALNDTELYCKDVATNYNDVF